MGDLNYRLNTTFEELSDNNRGGEALLMAQTKDDEFTVAQSEGNFVNYTEPKIEFLPTYKLKFDTMVYVNKRSQAPSYCDRVLFKNNSNFEVVDEFYKSREEILGSDHRPVQRSLTIKNFRQPAYADIQKLLDSENSV